MKEFKRITAFVLTLVLLMSSFAFADNLTTESAVVVEEPTATIVSPLENSIVSSDSFLVSVKLNKAATIKVSIYEEKVKKTEVVTSYVSGTAVTKTAVSYEGVNTTTFEAIDFKTRASYTDVLYTTPASYTSKDNIGFYSSTIENVEPGLYKVVVETVEEVKEEKVEVIEKETKEEVKKAEPEKITKYICVKAKEDADSQVFTQTKEKSGALSIISSFLKSLFK